MMYTNFKVQLDLSFNIFSVIPFNLIYFFLAPWALGWCGNSSNGLKDIRKQDFCVARLVKAKFYSFHSACTFDISEWGVTIFRYKNSKKHWFNIAVASNLYAERRLMAVHPLVGPFPLLPLGPERGDCGCPKELWIQTFRLALSSSVSVDTLVPLNAVVIDLYQGPAFFFFFFMNRHTVIFSFSFVSLLLCYISTPPKEI